MNLVQLIKVSKKYKGNIVLDSINLRLDNKYINIILGENGCGKSTLLKCINNFVSYNGKITFNGSTTYVPEKIYMPNDLKVIEYLDLIISIKKKTFNNYFDLIEQFNLKEHLNKEISKISFGTKQKIILLQALVEDVDIYLFDEPLNGLDKYAIDKFCNEITRLYSLNKIIIIVTHEESRISLNNIRYIKIKNGKVYD